MKYYIYILLCSDNTYYTGFTTDVEKRLEEHNLGKGAKYTREGVGDKAQAYKGGEGKVN